MGIISKTSDGVVKQPKPFPKLVIDLHRDIYLASSPSEGVIIVDNSKIDGIGYHETALMEYEDYEGTVSLSNE